MGDLNWIQKQTWRGGKWGRERRRNIPKHFGKVRKVRPWLSGKCWKMQRSVWMAPGGFPVSEGNTGADVELLENSAGKLMRARKWMKCSEPPQKRSFLRCLESTCQEKFVEDRNTLQLWTGSPWGYLGELITHTHKLTGPDRSHRRVLREPKGQRHFVFDRRTGKVVI